MEDAYKQIAPRLRGLRDALDLTVEDLADRAGVTADEVRLYESASVEIPVGYLLKVAQVCQVDLTTLISGDEARLRNYSLVRKGEGLEVARRKSYDYRDLAHKFRGRRMEPFLITVPPKEEKDLSFNHHSGQEFMYILEGRLEVRLDEKSLVLEPGDSLYFDSKTPHALRGLDGRPAVFLDVIL
ncbi:cupin domain-containing protein [Desulfovibrio aminophilus]|uniref:helix-turn-helix domain-containing protein n=1 Tax=Desulfovibrio aminophilus TaxID=81425 RepID=UPI00339515C3